MAVLATVTFSWEDAEGKPYHTSYTARDNNPSDGEVQALAEDAQALSALALVKAVVTREVDITGQADAAEAGSSRQRDSSLVIRTSLLRASRGRQHTFTLPQYKAALRDADGTIDPTSATVLAFLSNFDDGDAVPATVGDWFVGNQAEAIEDAPALRGFQNQD